MDAAKTVETVLAPVVWVNAAYCIVIESKNMVIGLTEEISRLIEKVGNMHQHEALLNNPDDAKKFEEKTGAEVEQLENKDENQNENLS